MSIRYDPPCYVEDESHTAFEEFVVVDDGPPNSEGSSVPTGDRIVAVVYGRVTGDDNADGEYVQLGHLRALYSTRSLVLLPVGPCPSPFCEPLSRLAAELTDAPSLPGMDHVPVKIDGRPTTLTEQIGAVELRLQRFARGVGHVKCREIYPEV